MSGEPEEAPMPATGQKAQIVRLVPENPFELHIVDRVRLMLQAVDDRLSRHHPDYAYLYKNEIVKGLTALLGRGVISVARLGIGSAEKDFSEVQKTFAEEEAIRSETARAKALHPATQAEATARAVAAVADAVTKLKSAGIGFSIDENLRIVIAPFTFEPHDGDARPMKENEA